MTVLATWAQQGLGQSSDDEGEAERLNAYQRFNKGALKLAEDAFDGTTKMLALDEE